MTLKDTYQLHVSRFGSGLGTLTIPCNATDTIGVVKEKISCLSNIPAIELQIYMNGSKLDDDQIVGSLGISNSTTFDYLRSRPHQYKPRDIGSSSSSDEDLQHVNLFTVDEGNFYLKCKRTDTIATVKQMIFDRYKIPVSEQHMILCGVVLEDTKKLEECYLTNASVIQLIRRQPKSVQTQQVTANEDVQQIYVDSKTKGFFTLTCKRTDTIATVKQMIFDRYKIPVSEQHMISRGVVLENTQTVEECHLTYDSIIQLQPKSVQTQQFTAEVTLRQPPHESKIALDDPFTLDISGQDRDSILCSVVCTTTDTISLLKEEISILTGIPVSDLKILLDGIELENSRVVKDCGLKSNTSLQYVNTRRQSTPRDMQREAGSSSSSSSSGKNTQHLYVSQPGVPGNITVTYEPTDTIAVIKDQISKSTGIPVSNLKILLDGKELEDSQVVKDCGLKSNTSLQYSKTQQNQYKLQDMPQKADSSNKDLQPVFVVTANKGNFYLECKRTDTIATVKQMIFDRYKIPVSEQHMILRGNVLQDTKKLEECHLTNASTIQLFRRQPKSVQTQQSTAEVTLRQPPHESKIALDDPFTLDISGQDRGSILCSVVCTTTDTISVLKEEISVLSGIPVSDLKILLDGIELEDSRVVKDCGLKSNTSLQYVNTRRHQSTPRDMQREAGSSSSSSSSGKNTQHLYVSQPGVPGNITVTYEPTDTIAVIKDQISKSTGIPVSNLKILLDGKELEDSRVVKDCGLKSNTSLQYVNTRRHQSTPRDMQREAGSSSSSSSSSSGKNTQYLYVSQPGVPGTITVTYEPTDTIAVIKDQISKSTGIPVSNLKILLDGKELEDSRVVKDCGLKSNTSLQYSKTQQNQYKLQDMPQKADSSNKDFQHLFVVTASKGNFPLTCKRTDTIATVKQMIFDRYKIPVPEQHMIYCGVVLQDTKRVEEYHFNNASTIQLIRRQPKSVQTQQFTATDTTKYITTKYILFSYEGVFDGIPRRKEADLENPHSDENLAHMSKQEPDALRIQPSDLIYPDQTTGIKAIPNGRQLIEDLNELVTQHGYRLVFHSATSQEDVLEKYEKFRGLCAQYHLNCPPLHAMIIQKKETDEKKETDASVSSTRPTVPSEKDVIVGTFELDDQTYERAVLRAFEAKLAIKAELRGQHIVIDSKESQINASSEENYRAFLISNQEVGRTLADAVHQVVLDAKPLAKEAELAQAPVQTPPLPVKDSFSDLKLFKPAPVVSQESSLDKRDYQTLPEAFQNYLVVKAIEASDAFGGEPISGEDYWEQSEIWANGRSKFDLVEEYKQQNSEIRQTPR